MTRPASNPSVPVSVLRRGRSFLVVDKPAGVVVEPGLGHRRDTLMNGLMAIEGAALAALGEERDWGLLHRLDRETSGCVLVALDARTYDALRAQFEARTVGKEYLAVVSGRPSRMVGEVRAALSEVRRGSMKVSVPARRLAGRPAITRWRVASTGAESSLLVVEIETGRLHQIRAHLALAGFPVTGDRVYRRDLPPNPARTAPGRLEAPLLLHAWRLRFGDPADGARIEVESPPPPAFAEAIRKRGWGDMAPLLARLRAGSPVSMPAGGRYADRPNDHNEPSKARGEPRGDRRDRRRRLYER